MVGSGPIVLSFACQVRGAFGVREIFELLLLKAAECLLGRSIEINGWMPSQVTTGPNVTAFSCRIGQLVVQQC